MFKINLVPELQQQKNKQAKLNTYATLFSAFLIIVVVVITALLISILGIQKLSLNRTNDQIAKVKVESEKYKELEETVLSLEAGIKSAKELMSGKNGWTILLAHIETATPSDTRYEKLNLEYGSAEASIKAKSVESFAKLVNSYKEYTVVVFEGTGTVGERISITSKERSGSTTINPDGTWTLSLKINKDESQEYSMTAGSSETKTITYNFETKSFNNLPAGTNAIIANLFTKIESRQYRLDERDNTYVFDLKFNFDGGLLW